MSDPTTDELHWRIIERAAATDYGVLAVRTHRAAHPVTGAVRQFTVIDTPDWVNVIPLTEAGEVVMVRQFRHGTERNTLEIPGGMVDPGESALEAGVRELREETGFAARAVRVIGSVEPNPALQSNRCATVLAIGCERVGELREDDGERIHVENVALSQIPGLIADGSITHALVVAAFFHFADRYPGWVVPDLVPSEL